MSLISRLLGRKEPTVAVVERTKRHWRDRKCSGSGEKAMIPTSMLEAQQFAHIGRKNAKFLEMADSVIKVGICEVCKRVLRPSKNNFLPSHLPLKESE